MFQLSTIHNVAQEIIINAATEVGQTLAIACWGPDLAFQRGSGSPAVKL